MAKKMKKIKIFPGVVNFHISVPKPLIKEFISEMETVGNPHTFFGNTIANIKGNVSMGFHVCLSDVKRFSDMVVAFCKKHNLELEG